MAYGAFKVEPGGTGAKSASQVNAEDSEIPSFLAAMSLAIGKATGEEAIATGDSEEGIDTKLIQGKNAIADEIRSFQQEKQ